MKKLFYPAKIIPEKNGAFTVIFPDIDGCITCGENIEQVYEMASEALGLELSYMEDEKEEIPKASNPQDITLESEEFLIIVGFDMDAYKRKHNSRAVKKTLTIPEWLNEEAMELGVNFSQVLQEGLINIINQKKMEV